MSNHTKWLRKYGVWLLGVAAILVAVVPSHSLAADDGFNIQVSPSPLVVTLTPGQKQTATLTVRNLSNHSETLVPSLSGFTTDKSSEKIELQPNVPMGLDAWVSFKQSTLAIAPGASQTLDIIYDTPSNGGFSYALAISLHRPDQNSVTSGATIKGSVAVFNLININRPDAKRELAVAAFTSQKSRYEYLPATFDLTIQNNGNVIDQPKGTLFIQRSFDDTEPIATLPINAGNRYILPNTNRVLSATWQGGFPEYVTTNGTTHLRWDWRKLSDLRIGKYVAKAVVIYNDGQHDIPLVASYTFWVIPWKLLLGVVIVVGLIATGIIAWGRMLITGTKKVKRYARRG
jgi:hypothetical protein